MPTDHAMPLPASDGPVVTAFSAAEVEAELVAYLHNEKTEIPQSVIEHFIATDPHIAEVYRELEQIADLLGHLPKVEPSREFVRRVMKSLPKLIAEGRATRRIEELLLRTKWTAEDRFVFFMEYWKHRFHHHPISSAALAATLLVMIGVLAWLPATVVQPERYAPPVGTQDPDRRPAVPYFPSLVDGSGNTWRDGSMPAVAPIPPKLVVYPRDDRMLPVDLTTVAPTTTDEPMPGRSRPVAEWIHGPRERDPAPPAGFLYRPQSLALGWMNRREQGDDVRGVTPAERRMIDAALAWLADNQNPDGSWGKPAGSNAGTTNDPSRVVSPDDATSNAANNGEAPLASPAHVQVTARVLLAFLADNYSSRPSNHSALQPRRSAASNMSRPLFEKQVERYREAVKRGFAFLQANTDPRSGRIGALGPDCVVAHAEAMTALAEDFLIGNNYRFRPTLDRAFDFLMNARNYEDGGWGIAPAQPSRLTPTYQAIQALLVYAKTPAARIDLNSPVFRHAALFMNACTSADDGMADETPKWEPGNPNLARSTTVAVALGHALWNTAQVEPATDFWHHALAFIGTDRYRPQWHVDPTSAASTVDFDYWMFGSQALAGWPTSTDIATRRVIENWRSEMIDMLRANQSTDGPTAGSWPNVGLAADLGPAWATATASLALQNRYRYAWLRR